MTRREGDLESWFEERQSAWLYRVLADHERDTRRAALFRALASAADDQANAWLERLVDAGASPAGFVPSRRARLVGWLIRWFGARSIRPVLAAMKIRGLSTYGSGAVPLGHRMPVSVEDVGQRHRGVAGGNLRAAVFGANDGLVSNLSLIMGIAGATSDARLVLLAGAAGLLAGAMSMAAGEWVSVRSQRELFVSQIDLERKELEQYPDEEAEELALIYAARGMDLEEARGFTRTMMRDPVHALDVLAREELGLNPDDLGSAWGAAVFSFVSFSAGAAVPLIPFVLGVRDAAIVWSGALSAATLLGIGAAISLFTGRGAIRGGVRMLAIGAAAGALTYALGTLFGLSLGNP